MRLLEGTAGRPGYDGPRHFDAHAYRTEDVEGVWNFARGCMRTYKILAERARAFDADPEVRELVAATLEGPDDVDALTRGPYSAERVADAAGARARPRRHRCDAGSATSGSTSCSWSTCSACAADAVALSAGGRARRRGPAGRGTAARAPAGSAARASR